MSELRELYQGQPALPKEEGVPKAWRKNHVVWRALRVRVNLRILPAQEVRSVVDGTMSVSADVAV